MKSMINVFVVFVFALLLLSCDSAIRPMDTEAVGGGGADVCNDQTFDLSSVDTFNRAMDVARAADTLKLDDLKARALARADAIFDEKVIDPVAYKDDPAVADFAADPDAASFLMMKCGAKMDLYNRTKIEHDVVEARKLKLQKADIDIKLLTVNTDKIIAERRAGDVRLKDAAAIGGVAEFSQEPFFCLPCEIALGLGLKKRAPLDQRNAYDMVANQQAAAAPAEAKAAIPRIADPDSEFSCGSRDFLSLCDTMLSGSIDNPDPCGIGYQELKDNPPEEVAPKEAAEAIPRDPMLPVMMK